MTCSLIIFRRSESRAVICYDVPSWTWAEAGCVRVLQVGQETGNLRAASRHCAASLLGLPLANTEQCDGVSPLLADLPAQGRDTEVVADSRLR